MNLETFSRDSLPSPPPYPGSGLTDIPGEMVLGIIIPFAGVIDYATFLLDRKTGNPDEIINFGPDETNNTGWILCSGSEVKAAVFPRLFNVFGYLYGKGNQEGQFMVPDYRGYFLRVLDTEEDANNLDPGLKSRKKYGTGQRVVNGSTGTDNGVGSSEECMVQMHQHHYYNYPGDNPVPPSPPPPPSQASNVQKKTGNPTSDLLVGGNVIPASDAAETRPINIYINYLVYAGLPVKQAIKPLNVEHGHDNK